jgi:hypothetical protein
VLLSVIGLMVSSAAAATIAYAPQGASLSQERMRRYAIEYAIIGSGIAVAIIATVYSIGPKLNSTFSSISSQLI